MCCLRRIYRTRSFTDYHASKPGIVYSLSQSINEKCLALNKPYFEPRNLYTLTLPILLSILFLNIFSTFTPYECQSLIMDKEIAKPVTWIYGFENIHERRLTLQQIQI